MKKSFIVISVAILLALLYPMLKAPYTPSSERAKCRSEIGCLRGYLLADDVCGRSFFSDFFPEETLSLEFRVGAFCSLVNQFLRERVGKEVFRVVPSPDENGMIIVDRWGTPYNLCTTAELKGHHSNILGNSAISNVVIWSSGPNRINEYGNNDDVALCRGEGKDAQDP